MSTCAFRRGWTFSLSLALVNHSNAHVYNLASKATASWDVTTQKSHVLFQWSYQSAQELVTRVRHWWKTTVWNLCVKTCKISVPRLTVLQHHLEFLTSRTKCIVSLYQHVVLVQWNLQCCKLSASTYQIDCMHVSSDKARSETPSLIRTSEMSKREITHKKSSKHPLYETASIAVNPLKVRLHISSCQLVYASVRLPQGHWSDLATVSEGLLRISHSPVWPAFAECLGWRVNMPGPISLPAPQQCLPTAQLLFAP